MDFFAPGINRLLDDWLNEDIGRGDLAGVALQNVHGRAHWITKKAGIFCGGLLVEKLFSRLDSSIRVNLLVDDGIEISAGQRLLELDGCAQSLVAGERTALNLAMRLSGIATATSVLVKQLEGTGVRLADTRKTTPGLRVLEKYAIRCGGGVNHRMGLDDAAMLKENHLAWMPDLEKALEKIRDAAPWTAKIIVEAETAQEAEDAICAGADGVLLDEFSPTELEVLVPRLRKLAPKSSSSRKFEPVVLEASGVQIQDIKSYSKTGIDLISTSSPITASSWLDFSMRFEEPDFRS